MAGKKVEGDALKKFVKLGAKGPLPFGFCPGPKDPDHTIAIHRTMKASALGKAAKAEGTGSKIAFGTFTTEGKVITLTCERSIPALSKLLKKYLKTQKIQMDVIVLDADGQALERDVEEAEAPQETPRESPPEPGDQKTAAAQEETPDTVETLPEDEEEDEDPGALADPEAYSAYLKKTAMRLRKKPMNFALAMPSGDPMSLRFRFDRKKPGKMLAGRLKKESETVKVTFGRAGTQALALEHGLERIGAKTLVLDLTGRELPRLAKQVRKMLRGMGVTLFRKIVILKDGAAIDEDTEDAPEAAASAAGAQADNDPANDPAEAGSADAEADLARSVNELRAVLGNVIIPTTAPPAKVKALQAAIAKLRLALDDCKTPAKLQKIMNGLNLVMGKSAALMGQYRGSYASVDATAELQQQAAVRQDLNAMLDGIPISASAPPEQVRKLAAAIELLRGKIAKATTQAEFDKLAGAAGLVVSKSVPLLAHGPQSIVTMKDAARHQKSWDSLPDRFQTFFANPKCKIPVTYQTMPELMKAAGRLRGLSDDDLQGFWRWMHIDAKNLRTLNAGISAYLGVLNTRARMGDRIFQSGEETGKTLAQHGDGDPIVADERIQRDFPNKEDAICYARSLKGAAAVVQEGGRFVVYKVTLQNSEYALGKDSLRLDDDVTTDTDTAADTALQAKERELLLAQLKYYGEYANFAAKFGNPVYLPFAALEAGVKYLLGESPTGIHQETEDEMNRLAAEVADLRAKRSAATAIKGGKSNLVALLTEDDYVLNATGDGGATVSRAGGGPDPYSGPLRLYGPGLKACSTPEELETQLELVMRDTAYAAIDKAEAAARELRANLGQGALKPNDQAALEQTLKAIKPFDEKLAEKERELLVAQLKLYGMYANFVAKAGNPMLWPIATIEAGWNLLNDKPAHGVDPAAEAEVDKLKAEVAKIRSQRSAAAAGFPLALRVADQEDFLSKSPAEQADLLRQQVDAMFVDIQATRENIDEGDFDLWTMPGVRDTAIAALDLKGDQLKWARDKAGWEQTKDTAFAVGEAVVAIGLAVGAIAVSGGSATGVVLAGASVAVGGYSAYNATEEYFRKGSAANIAIDPSQGLVDPEDVPHWGWVAAAWVGVGFDAAAVGSAIKAFRATKDLAKAAKILGVPADKIDEVLAPALAGRNVSNFSAKMMGAEAYAARFGDEAVEATTLITRNSKGGYDAEVILRPGADPRLREAAVLEEMRHISQISDPAFADDVARLTEDALAGWDAKKPVEKMLAKRSQLVLEVDAQKSLLAKLQSDLLKERDLHKLQDLEWEIATAQSSLARYQDELAEIEKAIPTGKPPLSVDLRYPPRLHNTAEETLAFTEAMKLPGIKEAYAALPDKELYLFAKTKDGIEIRRVRGAAAEARKAGKQLNGKRLQKGEDGVWSIVEGSKRDTATRRANILSKHGAPDLDEATGAVMRPQMEAKLAELSEPYFQAYARKYSEMTDAFEAAGGDLTAVFRRMEKGAGKKGADKAINEFSIPAFEEAFRRTLREETVSRLMRLKEPKRTTELLDLIKKIPDSADQGALFAAYRKASMGPALEIVEAAPNAIKLEGVKKFGDGLVEYTPPKPAKKARPGSQKAASPGPKKSGTYLAEDKSSLGAFDEDQLKAYLKKMGPKGNDLKNANGDPLSGVIYFLPDIGSARKVLRKIEKVCSGKLPPNLHLGYLQDGKMVWLQ